MIPHEKITIRISDTEIYELDYEAELKLSEETINEDLSGQPSLFAWYAVLAEKADYALSESKLAFELLQAELYEKYRKELAVSDGKVTEAMVNNRIKQDESYVMAQSAENEARKNYGIIRGIKEAFSHRKDMLVTLAANMRSQMDTTLYSKARDEGAKAEMPKR